MDFLKILKSFEEFVYEALTWLVLLPRTLWRIVVTPGRMTAYAAAQLASRRETSFSDAISPPLLLILCVLISHAIDLAVRAPTPVAEGTLSRALLSSEQNLLLYRTIAYGVWALVGALYLLVRARTLVDRETLRSPLYEQCYLVAPFALSTSVALTLIVLGQRWALLTAVMMFVLATAWFWLAQGAWLRARASLGLVHSLVAALVVLLAGSAINAGIGHVLGALGTPG